MKMGLKDITFKKNGKKITLNIKKCNLLRRVVGLMFKSRQTPSLLFEVKKPMAIHSLFVFFPFVAVWLDKNNNIIEIKKVDPFTLHVLPKTPFTKLVEIPINNRNKKILTQLKS